MAVDLTNLKTLLADLPNITDLQNFGDAWRQIEQEADAVKLAAIRAGETPPTMFDKRQLIPLMRKRLIQLFGSEVMTRHARMTEADAVTYSLQEEVDKLLS